MVHVREVMGKRLYETEFGKSGKWGELEARILSEKTSYAHDGACLRPERLGWDRTSYRNKVGERNNGR
jgi:hypothetical protein